MSDDEPKHTYSAREIVLDLFPATPELLIPKPSAYRLERGRSGALIILDRASHEVLRLTPLSTAGNITTQLCCDLCCWSGTRRYLHVLRAEVPGSNGRRFRYVTACRDTDACETRRWDDRPVEALLRTAS